MGQNKLFKFEQINQFKNVLQYPENVRGRWHEIFGNNHPITLELACGKGEYSVGLGSKHPDRNFIGVDVKGNRMYTGAKQALEQGLDNVFFLRAQIQQITEYFAPGEIDEIWIIFPDPFLRESKAKNRLTHQNFLHRYQQILKPGGIVQLKTDSKELFDFTVETVQELQLPVVHCREDIYTKPLDHEALEIKTFYEKMHLADKRLINYIAFQMKEEKIPMAVKKKKDVAS